MRSFVLACLSLLLVIPAEAQQIRPTSLDTRLPPDIPIVAEFDTTVLSSFAKPGDPLVLHVLKNVRGKDGNVAIPKGARLAGEVIEAQHGGWMGFFHWTPARISINVYRAEWDGQALALHADLFGFVRQTDSLAMEPNRHITSRYDTFTLQNTDFVRIPYNRRLDSAALDTSSSSESVWCNVDGTTGSYNCQSDGYDSSGGEGYVTGDRFELYRPPTSSLPSYLVKTDAHNDFGLGSGDVVILLNHGQE
jgi:hypothetical protein